MSGLHDIFESWSELWAHPRLWQAVWGAEEVDADATVRAVCRGVWNPLRPEGALEELLMIGAYGPAEMMLLDSGFTSAHAPAGLDAFKQRIHAERLAAAVALAERRSALADRARALGLRAGHSGLDHPDLARLRVEIDELNERVRQAEALQSEALRPSLSRKLRQLDQEAPHVIGWKAEVEQALQIRDFEGASVLIEEGPRPFSRIDEGLPRIHWPYRNDLLDVLGWFAGGSHPPWFGSWIPRIDEATRALTAALRGLLQLPAARWTTEQVQDFAVALATFLGVGRPDPVEADEKGWSFRLTGLGLPGIHLLSRGSLPRGLAFWVPRKTDDPPPLSLAGDPIVTRFSLEPRRAPWPGVLPVHARQLLALTPLDTRRRDGLLTALGRHIPLQDAVPVPTSPSAADSWVGDDATLSRITPLQRPVLVTGQPGSGRGSLLAAIFERMGGRAQLLTGEEALDTYIEGADVPLLFVDIDTLRPEELARLSGDLAQAWRRRGQPFVISGLPGLETRPELAELAAEIQVERLKRPSPEACETFVRLVLDFLQVRPTSPAVLRSLVHRSGQRWRVLVQLLRLVLLELEEDENLPWRATLSQAVLDRVWSKETLRDDLSRRLLAPIAHRPWHRVVLAAVHLASHDPQRLLPSPVKHEELCLAWEILLDGHAPGVELNEALADLVELGLLIEDRDGNLGLEHSGLGTLLAAQVSNPAALVKAALEAR